MFYPHLELRIRSAKNVKVHPIICPWLKIFANGKQFEIFWEGKPGIGVKHRRPDKNFPLKTGTGDKGSLRFLGQGASL